MTSQSHKGETVSCMAVTQVLLYCTVECMCACVVWQSAHPRSVRVGCEQTKCTATSLLPDCIYAGQCMCMCVHSEPSLALTLAIWRASPWQQRRSVWRQAQWEVKHSHRNRSRSKRKGEGSEEGCANTAKMGEKEEE